MRNARFALYGTLPADGAAAGEVWLRRARQFPDLLAAAEQGLAKSALTDLDKLRWLDVQSDALNWLHRPEEAKAAARTQLILADRLRPTDPNDVTKIAGYRMWALARLGRVEDAIAAGKRLVEAIPSTEQFRVRQSAEVKLAELYAYMNRPHDCCAILTKLLRVPSGLTVPMLKVDPAWDNVREDAGFKALLADPKNSAPL
jgi:tetratricopeptide (TPR) repeat protein